MENLRHYIELVAKVIESLGVIIIALGSFFFVLRYLYFYLARNNLLPFAQLRRELGRAILLGLEILVAADIVATVSTEPTMDSVLILAAIILIRTFLSFALEVELHGRFPWQAGKEQKEKEMRNE
ncbi:MAG: DUF1622 domain-containing protein [Bacteroidota bacterium]